MRTRTSSFPDKGVSTSPREEAWIMANALRRPLGAVGFALMIGLAAVTAMAGPVEISTITSENTVRSRAALKAC